MISHDPDVLPQCTLSAFLIYVASVFRLWFVGSPAGVSDGCG